MTDTTTTQNNISDLIKSYEENNDKTIDNALNHFVSLKDIENIEDNIINSKIEINSYGDNKLHYKLKRIVETIKFKENLTTISEELKKKNFIDNNNNYYLMNEKKPDVLPFKNCILFKIFECNVNNKYYEDNLKELYTIEENDKNKIIGLYGKLNEKLGDNDYVETEKSEFNEYLIENTNTIRTDSGNIVIKKLYCIAKVKKENNKLKLKYYRIKQSENNLDKVKINFVDIEK